MKKLGCVAILMFVLVSSFVVAGISVSEPLEIYNLKDKLYVSADGIIGADIGNLDFNLVCGNVTTILARLPAMAFSNEQEAPWNFYKILTMEGLGISNFSDIVGSCQIEVVLGADAAVTNVFTISDDVVVSVSTDKVAYDPGEGITVYIEAVKANGQLLNGFVQGENATSFSKAIEGGSVSEVFSTAETIEAGNYYLGVRAYDVDRSGTLNEGSTGISFIINQVASSLVMSLGNTVAMPGESFSVGVEVYDQSGIEMSGAVDVRFVSPDAEEFGMVVQAGDFGEFDFNSTSMVGIWRVIGSFNGIVEEREFEMESVQRVDFDFEDSVLTIANVGNVVYNRTISVGIGKGSEV